MTDASGSKTPFLFIMRKDFGQKLLKIMHNHFHDFQYTDMTWESTIVRAFKSDETFWSMNKPSTVPTADWNAFYAEMQQLKVDSGILTRRDRQQERNDKKVTQMKMRLLPLNWNNFDDPYSIFTYFTRNAGDNSDSIHFTRMVSVSIDGDEQRRRIRHKLIVISDRPINKPVTVRFDQQFGEHTEGMKFRLRGKIVFVGCRNIPDTVYVKMDPTAAFWKRGAEIKVMIYRANNIQHAVVMNNHMLVGIDGQHFVTKLTPVKKDDLKQQKVWQMEQIK
jgi:hypothetical protein